MIEVVIYPIYLKMINNKSYFKIISKNQFVELQLIGGKILKHEIHAEQYPDKLRIRDMLEDKITWPRIDSNEFQSILDQSYNS